MRIYVIFLKSINYPIIEPMNQDEMFGDLVKGRQVFGCFFFFSYFNYYFNQRGEGKG